MTSDWMVEAAYSIVPLLPSDPEEANAILRIVSEIINEIAVRHVRRRRPRLVGGRSGAALSSRLKRGTTKSRSPR